MSAERPAAGRPAAGRPELTKVTDAGHLPWLDGPEAAAAATVAFLGAEVGTEPRT
jgi:pimeloyl-ACP methyl ester carboxylesterase